MTFSIDPFEGFWLITNSAAAIITLFALLDARRDKAAVKLVNGAARTLISKGNVRREAIRLGVQLFLLVAVYPALVTARPLLLSIVALSFVPSLLLIASILDTRERNALNIITVADVVAEFERIAAEVAKANAAAQAGHEAAIAVIDGKVDAVAADAAREIRRTDVHQEVQDNRIDNVEERE